MAGQAFETKNEFRRERRIRIQKEIIPELALRNYDPVRSLKILHRYSTSKDPSPYENIRRLREAVIKEIYDITSEQSTELHETGETDGIKIIKAPSGKGHFRLIGSVQREEKPLQKVWAFIAINTGSRLGQDLYFPPLLDVDKLMNQLSDAYLKGVEQSNGDLAQNLILISIFFMIGNGIIHPFMGANHRAFDRFTELELYKLGVYLNPPMDASGNIKDQRLNNIRELFVRNFLKNSRLNSRGHGLAYQTIMSITLKDLIREINEPHVLIWGALSAKQYLNWIRLPNNERLPEDIKAHALEHINTIIKNSMATLKTFDIGKLLGDKNFEF